MSVDHSANILFSIVATITIIASLMISSNGSNALSTFLLKVDHIIIAFLCPITLFIPKIWPPLAAKISKNYRVSLKNQLQDPLLSVHSVMSIVRHQIT